MLRGSSPRPISSRTSPQPPPNRGCPLTEPDRDLEGIDIKILPDGTVHLHAACRPGEDNARCQARIDALIEALGVDPDAVVTEIDGEPA